MVTSYYGGAQSKSTKRVARENAGDAIEVAEARLPETAEASFGEEKAVASYRTPKAAFGREILEMYAGGERQGRGN